MSVMDLRMVTAIGYLSVFTEELLDVTRDDDNALMRKLQRELHVTSVLVTHDIRAGFRVANRVNLLREGRIVFEGTPEEMIAAQDSYITAFLS